MNYSAAKLKKKGICSKFWSNKNLTLCYRYLVVKKKYYIFAAYL